MKDGFVCQRRFVGHQKKNHFRIIVVCMKYKSCVSRLLYEDTRSLRSKLLYGNYCRGGTCSCGHNGSGDGNCGCEDSGCQEF